MENLNLLFYKTFYSKLGQREIFENDITAKGKKLTSAKFYKEDYKPVCSCIAPDKFLLKTLYPGLLAGIGYAHGVDSGNDIKVGFSFDYVTGQPYIPGSSVKGLLRSYFRHPEVIQQLLGKDLSVSAVRALENSIFEADDDAVTDADIFFDAVIKCGDKEGLVLGFDSITPHGEDLTKNPVPIKIVKILPDVVIEFSFNLKDSSVGNITITSTEKENLFKEILCNFGIGAKTNVGYGVLTAVDENEINDYPEKTIIASGHNATRKTETAFNCERPEIKTSAISKNELPVLNNYYNCTVINVRDFGIFVKIDGTAISGLIHKSKLNIPRDVSLDSRFSSGDKIIAEYLGSNEKGHSFAFKDRR